MPSISRTHFALLLHTVPHLGPKGVSRLISELPSSSPDTEVDLSTLRFWNLSADTLQHEYKLHPDAAQFLAFRKDELLTASEKIAASVERLGIRVIMLTDPDYPPEIKEYAKDLPPIVYAYGNLGLLRERKFAVISSSNISAHSAEVLRDLAGTLSDQGLAVVTSHNTHPYQVAGLAAKSRNAPIILVLDRGILSAFPQGLKFEPIAQARIWNLRFDPERDLILSCFRLYDRWIGANGKERDRMVFALADIVVAVEVRAGGVMENECLHAKTKGREVYVYKPETGELPEGNRSLIEKGLTPIPANWAHSFLTTLDLPDSEEEIEYE